MDAIKAAVTADNCDHWALGVIAGFAGCLVDLAGLQSSGIHFSGKTSVGKSTAQRLAVSVWVLPKEADGSLMQVARATVNATEAMAARANGSVFVLDEMAHLSAKETALLIYAVAGGRGKGRLNDRGEAREARGWSTFSILSGEVALAQKVRSGGESWTGGMAVRSSAPYWMLHPLDGQVPLQSYRACRCPLDTTNPEATMRRLAAALVLTLATDQWAMGETSTSSFLAIEPSITATIGREGRCRRLGLRLGLDRRRAKIVASGCGQSQHHRHQTWRRFGTLRQATQGNSPLRN